MTSKLIIEKYEIDDYVFMTHKIQYGERLLRYYGRKFPKTAQEIIDSIKDKTGGK